MKTLLITLEYPPFYGGVANYYANLSKFWPEASGLEVLDNSRKELVDDGRSFLKWLPAVLTLRRYLKKRQFDHLLVGQILPLGTAAWWLSKFYKFDYTVIIHGMDFTFALKQERKKQLAKKILGQAKRIICSNNYTANLVRDFLGQAQSGKVAVVNPGVDASSVLPPDEKRITELREKHGLVGKFVLLALGRLVKRKGVDRLIASLPLLGDRLREVSVVVAGSGPDEAYLKNYAGSAGARLADHILFVDSPDEDDKWQWLHMCDCLAMPSREEAGDYEGFGIVYLEAGLCGKPVIAGASGGIADAVLDSQTGLLVEPDNPAAIAAAILALLDDRELGRRLGQAGQARAKNDFLWQKQSRLFYSIINDSKA
jgi:phosphatidylinositol alpha-1,6-mannosyltransferase